MRRRSVSIATGIRPRSAPCSRMSRVGEASDRGRPDELVQAAVEQRYAADRWPRLETEYVTVSALNAGQLAAVPNALLRDDDLSYAVYSFEPGTPPSATELTQVNVEAIAAFIADLHRFTPDDAGNAAAGAR